MESLADECSLRYDRPTFVVRSGNPRTRNFPSFEEFAARKPEIPTAFLRKHYDDLPHDADASTVTHASRLAESDFLQRSMAVQRYEVYRTTTERKDPNRNVIPALVDRRSKDGVPTSFGLFQTEGREDEHEDLRLPSMD